MRESSRPDWLKSGLVFNMPRTKFNPRQRTPQEKERDLAFIARLYLRGRSLAEIRVDLNRERVYDLSYDTIRDAVKELHNRWKESYLVDFDQVKATELARLDKLEQAYWEGWERSLKDREETKQESKVDTAAGKVAYKRDRAEKKTIGPRDGNVSFLKGVERCITLRLKVFGLIEQRTRHMFDWKKEAVKAGIEESDLNQEFERIVEQYSSAMGAGDDERGVEGG